LPKTSYLGDPPCKVAEGGISAEGLLKEGDRRRTPGTTKGAPFFYRKGGEKMGPATLSEHLSRFQSRKGLGAIQEGIYFLLKGYPEGGREGGSQNLHREYLKQGTAAEGH